MKMSPALRRELRKYHADLMKRVRKVACKRCRAKKGKACIGQYGREIDHCCGIRHEDAKYAGYVKGRAWHKR